MLLQLVCLILLAFPSVQGGNEIWSNLNGEEVKVYWVTNFDTQTVSFTFEGNVKNAAWWAVGFSDHGEYNVSDYCQLDVREGKLWDGFVNSRFEMSRDRQQDCHLEHVDGRSFTFIRKFSTCDPKDYAFETGTAQIYMARSTAKTSNFTSPSVSVSLKYGVLLNEPMVEEKPKEQDQRTLHIAASNAKVPSEVTTYWCIVQRLPDVILTRKHHVTWLWSNVTAGNEDIVHHLMVFHCPTGDQKEFEGNCNDPKKPKVAAACSKVIGAVSMGEGPIVYPENVGLPIGGPDYNPFVMVEIHYNNVAKKAGIVDSSGFDLIITPHLREHDAGIIEIGQIYGDANSIPPGQKAFTMTGYCTADCTDKFPKDGIHIFLSQMHGHLVMRKLWNSLYRNGVKVGEFNRDNHYSPHWQHVIALKPTLHVHRGDVLTTTCIFDTSRHTNVVLGGYGIEDEMCISYNYYWPASEIEMCKSAVSNATLHRFFKQKGIKNSELSIAQKYKSVTWDEENVRDLSELFATAPVNQHCYRFDGSTFPGHPTNWSAIEHPHLTFGAYEKGRQRQECPALND